jgi:cytochrome b561
LLTLAMLGFGPIILSTAFRKIRRNKVENLSGIWERITDLAIIFFISYLTTTSLVGAVSALAGASVSISEHSQSVGLMVAAIATVRVLLEELAAAGFTARLEHINPTEVDGPSKLQTWFSLLVKYAVLCYMLAPIVGSGWQLWVGAFVIFFPSLVGQFDLQLPTSKFVWQIIPSGLVALTIATLVAGWSGTLVELLFGDFENFKDLSFVLSPIPVIALSLLAMFAEPSQRIYEKLGRSKVIYVIGGIAIYLWTLDVSGFWAALAG